ncbi:hypothetical protein [Rhizomicrobium electricum]|uniref:Uncharacterized protein n=1 Tax=Rhizomicrobium electricum TaxID=480070 RepID=A0ABP3P4J8_9PROT|nr:hypothetical protein [Rhizomicrobium electricum]NIJ47792.1 hypothetical protein [Rhizomicrobium electricum]
MTRAQTIITANKVVSNWGNWQTGNMPPAAFPLSKRRGRCLKFGTAIRWRLVQFEACGLKCRLVIGFNLPKETYVATLAVEQDRDMSVLLSYEFHGTHPGWHIHGACGDVNGIPEGSLRGQWQRRFPKPRGRHRRGVFGVSDDGTAFQVADEFFQLHNEDGTLPL